MDENTKLYVIAAIAFILGLIGIKKITSFIIKIVFLLIVVAGVYILYLMTKQPI